MPWAHLGRIVCADSYFASVGCAAELHRLGLRFIGVVKTATRKFPMKWLSEVELAVRGDRKGLVTRAEDGKVVAMAYVWMDRERRYFITNTASLSEGKPYVRYRWRQVSQVTNADPERVELVVAQPEACEIYYATCGLIDQHNRHRQDTLQLERKIETKDWAVRVGTSLLAMMVVDTWLVYNGATATTESQQDFYTSLSEELIDNIYDQVGGTLVARMQSEGVNHSPDLVDRRTGAGRSGIMAHLTPTKKKRKTKEEGLTNHSLQGRCRVCGLKTRYVCSQCNDDDEDQEGLSAIQWICHTETQSMCFPEHVVEHHS